MPSQDSMNVPLQAVLEMHSRRGLAAKLQAGLRNGVGSALGAMLRVAAAEFPSIRWEARECDAHAGLLTSLVPSGPAAVSHGSFGTRVISGTDMPAMLTAAPAPAAFSEVITCSSESGTVPEAPQGILCCPIALPRKYYKLTLPASFLALQHCWQQADVIS